MKEIKDYLHLYLGCECEYFDFISNKVCIGELEGIADRHFAFIKGDRNGCPMETIKPILRPLSDMTEEEALYFINDVFKFRQQFGHRVDDYKIEKGFLSFTYHNSNGGNGGHRESVLLIKNWGKDGEGEWVFNCSYSMNDVVWLLSKHFDLFGLIDSGLAIDSTHLTSPSEVNLKINL